MADGEMTRALQRNSSSARSAPTCCSLALAQLQAVPCQKEANLRRAEVTMADAAERGASAIVFPEMFLSGYVWEPAGELAEPKEGPSIRTLRRLAKQYRLLTVCGFPERNGSRQPYNSSCVINPDGEVVGWHRKVHLFRDEQRYFSAGDRFDVCQTSLGPIGVLICYDLEFPESARLLALRGARLVVVPTACMEPYREYQAVYARARAMENGVFVAVTNTIGSDGKYSYFGESAAIDPCGNVLCLAKSTEEVPVVKIDFSSVPWVRKSSPYLDRRRPEIYSELADAHGPGTAVGAPGRSDTS
jgi:predicted amidohydrolase